MCITHQSTFSLQAVHKETSCKDEKLVSALFPHKINHFVHLKVDFMIKIYK